MLRRGFGLALFGGMVHAGLELLRLLKEHAQGWGLWELAPGAALEAALATLALWLLLAPWRRRAVQTGLLVAALGTAQVGARALVPGDSAPPLPEGEAPGARTVVLLTLDTLRRDHVSAHPDAVHPGLTPAIDALAGEGWFFLDAVSPSPLTLPTHAAFLTGRHPVELGLIRNGRALPDVPTVPEALAAHGYRTAAFVSSPVLHGDHGLERGFLVYRDALGPAGFRHLLFVRLLGDLRSALTGHEPSPTKERGDRTVDGALGWLARQPEDAAVFLWVHLYDAHTPHTDRPELEPSSRPDLGHSCDWSAHPSAIRRAPPHPFRPLRAPLPPEALCRERDWSSLDRRLASYAAEVRFVDRQVGRLLEGLEAAGRENASIVLVADHGESLVEHQQHVRHQYALYTPVVRVPLVVRAPGLEPAIIEETVGTVRVAATLRRLAGLPPDPTAAGPDLLSEAAESLVVATGPAPLAPTQRTPAQVLAVSGPLEVLRDGSGHVERYDREVDPREQWPLLTEEEQTRLTEALRAFGRPAADRPVPGLFQAPLDDAAREALTQPGVSGRRVEPTELDRFAALDAEARRFLERWETGAEAGADELSDELREALEALGYL